MGWGGGRGGAGVEVFSLGSASASALRPHPRPAASLTPPTRARRVSAGGRGQGSGAGLPGFPPSRQGPPLIPPASATFWPLLAGRVGGWSDAWMHTQGLARVPPGSPIVSAVSTEARRVVREARGPPARRQRSDCPHTGPPRARLGFVHPRCCRSQGPGPVYRALACWAPAVGLGDSCVFLSALLRWRFDTALLCLNDQQLEIYVQSPCWVNTRLTLCL